MVIVCRILRCLGVSHVAGHTEGEVHGCLWWLGGEKDGFLIRGGEREGIVRGC
jgi:hypothetical protein